MDCDLSWQELGRLAGMSASGIWKIATGKVKPMERTEHRIRVRLGLTEPEPQPQPQTATREELAQ